MLLSVFSWRIMSYKTSWRIFVKFFIAVLLQNLLSLFFATIGPLIVVFYLREQINFYSSFHCFLKDVGKIQHGTATCNLLRICGFCWNRWGKIYTLLKEVHKSCPITYCLFQMWVKFGTVLICKTWLTFVISLLSVRWKLNSYDLGEGFASKADENFRISWKSVRRMSYLPYGRKQNYTLACTVKL